MRIRYTLFQYFGGKILKISLLIFSFFIFGVGGFMIIEEYSFLDALWFTTITLSTVGYEMIGPQSDAGKIFTIILILSSFGVLAYAFSAIAQDLIDGQFFERYRMNKMKSEIKAMNGHVIICGFGRSGLQAAKRLYNQNHPFVVIDKSVDNEKIREDFKNVHFFEGDATEDQTLELVNIHNAAGLIAALPKDSDNLFVVLTARQLNDKLRIISRASLTTSIPKLKMAGADNVIMPDQIGGEHMAALIVTPDLHEFVDLMFTDNNDGANLIELDTNQQLKNYIGSPIKDLHDVNEIGCLVIGYKKQDGEYIINPHPNTTIQEGTRLILIGQPQQIGEATKKFFG